MFVGFDWREASAMTIVATAVGGMVIWWVRAHLSGTFASRTDTDRISARLDALETRLSLAPTHADIASLSERVSSLEKGVAVVGADLRSLGESMLRLERAVEAGFQRQERQLHLLTENELRPHR